MASTPAGNAWARLESGWTGCWAQVSAPRNLCTIRFHHELRGGDEIDVSCAFSCADGKTFRIDQEYRRPDGTLVAELTTVAGLLDLARRRLIPNPAGHVRALASAPEVLGL